ncbi:MAG: T9SS type A sorting domain-containing protein, partial [Bacteroidota bacterium]
GRWWVVPQGSSRAATPSHDELTTNANTSSSPDLLLYPTIPTEGLVNLYYESVETPQLKVAFYGANGQLVKHTVLNAFVTTAVDVSQFSAGTYVVRAGDLPVRKMIIR